MSGPSEKAIAAAHDTLIGYPPHNDTAREALGAAHDSALGLDRSVCLRDVVEALAPTQERGGWTDAADFIEREFGGGA